MPYSIDLWETAGSDDYARLRPLIYPQTDIFLCCYGLRDPVTLQRLENICIPEIKDHEGGQTFDNSSPTTRKMRDVADDMVANIGAMGCVDDCVCVQEEGDNGTMSVLTTVIRKHVEVVRQRATTHTKMARFSSGRCATQ